jgi:hypothetical protein
VSPGLSASGGFAPPRALDARLSIDTGVGVSQNDAGLRRPSLLGGSMMGGRSPGASPRAGRERGNSMLGASLGDIGRRRSTVFANDPSGMGGGSGGGLLTPRGEPLGWLYERQQAREEQRRAKTIADVKKNEDRAARLYIANMNGALQAAVALMEVTTKAGEKVSAFSTLQMTYDDVQLPVYGVLHPPAEIAVCRYDEVPGDVQIAMLRLDTTVVPPPPPATPPANDSFAGLGASPSFRLGATASSHNLPTLTATQRPPLPSRAAPPKPKPAVKPTPPRKAVVAARSKIARQVASRAVVDVEHAPALSIIDERVRRLYEDIKLVR